MRGNGDYVRIWKVSVTICLKLVCLHLHVVTRFALMISADVVCSSVHLMILYQLFTLASIAGITQFSDWLRAGRPEFDSLQGQSPHPDGFATHSFLYLKGSEDSFLGMKRPGCDAGD